MENKALIVYKSKYGSTRCYAGWIARQTGADIYDLSNFDATKLHNYQVVLFGSSVHIGRIKHVKFIYDYWDILKEKTVIVFTATGAPANDPGHQKVFELNFSPDIRDKIKYYPLHGAYYFKNLDLGDKLLMQGPKIANLIQWWFHKDPKAKKFLDEFYAPHDWTDEKAVYPIVSLVKQQKTARLMNEKRASIREMS